jgi:hypothetical protein
MAEIQHSKLNRGKPYMKKNMHRKSVGPEPPRNKLELAVLDLRHLSCQVPRMERLVQTARRAFRRVLQAHQVVNEAFSLGAGDENDDAWMQGVEEMFKEAESSGRLGELAALAIRQT